MLSVLVFMCRDPGDATSKVSCCVETSYCFKNGDFRKSARSTPIENEFDLKSFIVIMLLHKGLTHIHPQKVAFRREFHLKVCWCVGFNGNSLHACWALPDDDNQKLKSVLRLLAASSSSSSISSSSRLVCIPFLHKQHLRTTFENYLQCSACNASHDLLMGSVNVLWCLLLTP